MFVVEEGDLVRMEITNDTSVVHPMHLHGHHALVLSRNGQPATGSPWWTDTLNVDPGDAYVIAFRADNPGVWMDHCHNLGHAAAGLTMHVVYAGVTTPFLVGTEHDNAPE
jgi:FtsP/CotA-like multicopper oxidase with cupredoxin domain